MNRFFSLFLFLPLYFLAMIYLMFLTFFQVEVQALDDWRIKTIVNYCSDSAIEELVEASDLGMDYNEWGKFKTDPELALDDFVNTFLLNYNIPINDTNKELVKTKYIQVMCIAGYDGYYMYDHQKVAEGDGYTLVSSPKMPYIWVDDTKPTRYVTYALNMGYEKAYRLTDATLAFVDSPVSQRDTMRIINNRISDDLNARVQRAYTGGWLSSIYIPVSLTTVRQTNPIESPTVMAFIDNVDIDSYKPVSAFGIGGSRAKVARPVSVYNRKNPDTGEWVKYYAYSDLLPDSVTSGMSAALEIYMSPQDAAEAGYHHDPLFMN